MSFFGSELGVAIAWICSVVSLIYAFFQKQQNNKLKVQLLNSLNTTTTNVIDSSKDDVTQTGKKNVYTKNNSGGMNIKM